MPRESQSFKNGGISSVIPPISAGGKHLPFHSSCPAQRLEPTRLTWASTIQSALPLSVLRDRFRTWHFKNGVALSRVIPSWSLLRSEAQARWAVICFVAMVSIHGTVL